MSFRHKKFWAMLCSFAIAFSTAVSPAGATSLGSSNSNRRGVRATNASAVESGVSLRDDGTSSDFDGYEFVTWSYVDNSTVNNDGQVVFYKYGVDKSLPGNYSDQGTISGSFNPAYHLVNETKSDFFRGDHLDSNYDSEWPAGKLNKQYVSGTNRYVWKLAGFPETFAFRNISGCGYRHVHIYVAQKGYDVEQNKDDYPNYLKDVGEFSDYWSYGGWSPYIHFTNFMPKIKTVNVGGNLAKDELNLSKGDVTTYFICNDLADQYGYNPFKVTYEIVAVGRYSGTLQGVTVDKNGMVTIGANAPDNTQFYVKATITNPYDPNDKVIKKSCIATISDPVNLVLAGGTIPNDTESNEPKVVELQRGQAMALPTPTKAGYDFENWKGDDSSIYTNGDIYTGEKDLQTLTAQYEEKKHNVSFLVPATDSNKYNVKDSKNEIMNTFEVSEAAANGGKIELDNYKVCEGESTDKSLNFIEWAVIENGKLTKKSGSIDVRNDMTIYGITTDCSDLGLIFVETDQRGAAIQVPNYYVNENANSGTSVELSKNDEALMGIIKAYSCTGYSIDELQYKNPEGSSDSVTLDLFKEEGSTINLKLNSESYEVEGKTCDFNAGHIKLTWKGNLVDLSLNPGNGENNSSVRATYGEKYESLPTPTWDDTHNFLGWYTAADGGFQVREGDKVQDLGDEYKPSEGSATLYAKWEEKGTIHFDPNGGTFVDDNSTSIMTKSLAKTTVDGEDQYFYQGKFPEVERQGYDFQGWYYVEDGVVTDEEAREDDSFGMTTELCAKWEAMTMYVYQKVKDPNADKTTTVTKLIGEYGKELKDSEPAASKYTNWVEDLNGTDYCPAGYRFEGWYVEVLDEFEEPTGEKIKVTGDTVINFIDSTNVYAEFVESGEDAEIFNFVNSLYSLEGKKLDDEYARYGDDYDAQLMMLDNYSKLSPDQRNKLSKNLQGVGAILQSALKIKHAMAENGISTDSVLSANARLNVAELSLDSEAAQRIKELTGEDILNLWDISLVDVLKNNVEFDLEGDSIRIKIPASLINEANLDGKKIVHLKSNGQIEYLIPSLEGDYYVIEMSSFSPVAVVTDSTGSTNNGLMNVTGGKATTGDNAPMLILLTLVLSACTLIVFVASRKKKFN